MNQAKTDWVTERIKHAENLMPDYIQLPEGFSNIDTIGSVFSFTTELLNEFGVEDVYGDLDELVKLNRMPKVLRDLAIKMKISTLQYHPSRRGSKLYLLKWYVDNEAHNMEVELLFRLERIDTNGTVWGDIVIRERWSLLFKYVNAPFHDCLDVIKHISTVHAKCIKIELERLQNAGFPLQRAQRYYVKRLLRENKLIPAVKYVRRLLKCSLKEAKATVDLIREKL